MTALFIRAAALDDVSEALDWYRNKSSAGAEGFADELDAVVAAIEGSPLKYPKVHRDVRRALTRRFPYAVYFITEGDRVIVLRVLHQARNPRLVRRQR